MYAGKLTNRYGEELDLELETLYTVLATMGGHIEAERMAEFATALMCTQRGRQLLQEELDQEKKDELLASFGEWLQQRGIKAEEGPSEQSHDVILSKVLPGDHEMLKRAWNDPQLTERDRAFIETVALIEGAGDIPTREKISTRLFQRGIRSPKSQANYSEKSISRWRGKLQDMGYFR